jgi:hypothetical protein
MESFLGALKNPERKTDDHVVLNMVRRYNNLKCLFSKIFENRPEILKSCSLAHDQLSNFKGV